MNLVLAKRYLDMGDIKVRSVLDIGANKGEWTAAARTVWPNAEYLLIDGNPECWYWLNSINERFSIALLSDTEGESEFWYSARLQMCTGASVFREQTDYYSDEYARCVILPTRKLDDLLLREPFDLIKMDVQGSELRVIRGGVETIRHARALILETSLIEYNKGAPLHEEIIDVLSRHDFYPKVILGHHTQEGRVIQQDVLFTRGMSHNCVHRSR